MREINFQKENERVRERESEREGERERVSEIDRATEQNIKERLSPLSQI